MIHSFGIFSHFIGKMLDAEKLTVAQKAGGKVKARATPFPTANSLVKCMDHPVVHFFSNKYWLLRIL